MEFSNPMMTMPVTTAGTNDGFGNNVWNNPFMYLIWLAIFRQGGFFGNGVDPTVAGQTLNSAQVDAIRDTVAQIHSDVTCGNANGMRLLDQIAAEARALGVAVTDINGNICDTKTAILGALTNIAFQSSQETASVVAAVKDCCCATQSRLDSLGCGIEKQILNQTNSIQAGFTTLGNCMSPIGMLLTGITIANIDLIKIFKKISLYAVSLIRLVIIPLIGIAVLKFIPIGYDLALCTCCCLAMPLGVNTIVVPSAYGKDTTVAAGLALVSHLLSCITIPLIFMLFNMVMK